MDKRMTGPVTMHTEKQKNDAIQSLAELVNASDTLYAADYICQENDFAFGAAPVQDKPTLQKCLKQINVTPRALELIFKSMKSQVSKMHDKGLF
jgi:hypothetical protein